MNEDAQLSSPQSVQKFAIDVAYRLSSLRNFLETSDDLCRYSERFTDADIQQHGRKLLAIMEVARTTLNLAGVKLHLFTSCPPKLQQYKSAYFRMLVLIIRQNQDRFPTDLRGRVDRLLLPLTTRLFIWRNRDPYAQLGIADLMRNVNSRSGPQGKPQLEQPSGAAVPFRVPPWPLHNIAASMPPPDAFPSKVTEGKCKRRALLGQAARRSRPVHKRHPAQLESNIQRSIQKQYPAGRDPETHNPVHKQNAAPLGPETDPHPNDEDEEPVVLRLPTRVCRHFGIFCTANNQQSRRSLT